MVERNWKEEEKGARDEMQGKLMRRGERKSKGR
jgi:hypothetical protein